MTDPTPDLINLPAFRAAAETGQPVTISAEQLRVLLDAYETEQAREPDVLAAAGDVVRVTLPVIVPRGDLERLQRGRRPLFVYGAAEISRATDVPYQTVRRAIRQGLIEPGNLAHVIALPGRISRLGK